MHLASCISKNAFGSVVLNERVFALSSIRKKETLPATHYGRSDILTGFCF